MSDIRGFAKSFEKDLLQPIHKGGDRRDVNNYRPISVLISLFEVLESIRLRLIGFLDGYNVLSENQYGYRKCLSIVDKLLLLD